MPIITDKLDSGYNRFPLTTKPGSPGQYRVRLGVASLSGNSVSLVNTTLAKLDTAMRALLGKPLGEYRFSHRLKSIPYGKQKYRNVEQLAPKYYLLDYDFVNRDATTVEIWGTVDFIDDEWFTWFFYDETAIYFSMRADVDYSPNATLDYIVSFDIEPVPPALRGMDDDDLFLYEVISNRALSGLNYPNGFDPNKQAGRLYSWELNGTPIKDYLLERYPAEVINDDGLAKALRIITPDDWVYSNLVSPYNTFAATVLYNGLNDPSFDVNQQYQYLMQFRLPLNNPTFYGVLSIGYDQW